MDTAFHARMAPNLQPWTLGVRIPYTASFTSTQYERIKRGHVPMEMEDKWYIYYEESHLWFVRSWTGLRVFKVTLRECVRDEGRVEAAERRERTEGSEGSEASRGTTRSEGGHKRPRGRGRSQEQGHRGGAGAVRGRGQGHNDRGDGRGYGRAPKHADGSRRGDSAAVMEVAEALWAEQLAKDKAMLGFQVEELKSLIENLLLHGPEEHERDTFQADGEDIDDQDMAETTPEEQKKSKWRFWKS